MKNLVIAGNKVQVSDKGFPKKSEQWNTQVAQGLAENLGVGELSDEQMEIIGFLRNYYNKFKAFPILNYVCKHVKQPQGCLNNEFVNPMNAWKIAGLPELDGIHFVAVDGKNFKLEECC